MQSMFSVKSETNNLKKSSTIEKLTTPNQRTCHNTTKISNQIRNPVVEILEDPLGFSVILYDPEWCYRILPRIVRWIRKMDL